MGPENVFVRDIPSDFGEGRKIVDHVEDTLNTHGWPESDVFRIKLATEEAVVNAIKHGNQMDPAKRVMFHMRLTQQRVEILIRDEGAGFDPGQVPDATDPQYIERPGGRGLLLMRGFMTDVQYRGIGNEVFMVKERSGQEAAAVPQAQ